MIFKTKRAGEGKTSCSRGREPHAAMEGKIILKTKRVVKGNPHAAPKEEMTQKVAQFQDMVGVEASKSRLPTQDLIHYSKNSKLTRVSSQASNSSATVRVPPPLRGHSRRCRPPEAVCAARRPCSCSVSVDAATTWAARAHA